MYILEMVQHPTSQRSILDFTVTEFALLWLACKNIWSLS